MTSSTDLMSSLPFLAFLVPLFMAWTQIKGFFFNLTRFVVTETQVSGPVSIALLNYLRTHGKRLPTNVIKFASIWTYVKSKGDTKILLFEGSRDLPLQWYWYEGNIFSVIEKRGHDKERGISVDNLTVLRYLRGTVKIEKLLKEAITWFEDKDKKGDQAIKSPRFYVQRFIGVAVDSSLATMQQGNNREAPVKAGIGAAEEDWKFSRLINYPIDDLGYSSKLFFHVFNDNARKIKRDVEKWFKSKDWYAEKGLLWRRGALLHGFPGSGKSSLIRKIGQTMDVPVLSFELSTMTDRQLISFWDEARRTSPCIAVMEDIDTVFKGREPANANIRLSFECLLNCISGVEPAEGVYLFVTTNKLELLDEALGIPTTKGTSTRPGRLDNCFHMGEILEVDKQKMVDHFLAGQSEIGAALIQQSNGCTAAQFSDMCSQKALELFWKEDK